MLSATTLVADSKPLVVASLSSVLGDLAKNVGGNKVEVIDIVKAGKDPHDFNPTPVDVKKIAESRIVLASGLGMESYLDSLQKNAGKNTEFLIVGTRIKPLMTVESHHHGHKHETHEGKVPDPHWWHSIANVKIATNVLRDAFSAADPANRDEYYRNAAVYQKQLDVLEKWAKLQIAQLPRDKRVLVTSHDALGYLARDYGFAIEAVEGINPADQPSSKKVRDIIALIRKENVKAIFPESTDNPKVLQEITKESGAKIAPALCVDGLGGDHANTYDAMMRHNISCIIGALK